MKLELEILKLIDLANHILSELTALSSHGGPTGCDDVITEITDYLSILDRLQDSFNNQISPDLPSQKSLQTLQELHLKIISLIDLKMKQIELYFGEINKKMLAIRSYAGQSHERISFTGTKTG